MTHELSFRSVSPWASPWKSKLMGLAGECKDGRIESGRNEAAASSTTDVLV